jgi:hypothetical protein
VPNEAARSGGYLTSGARGGMFSTRCGDKEDPQVTQTKTRMVASTYCQTMNSNCSSNILRSGTEACFQRPKVIFGAVPPLGAASSNHPCCTTPPGSGSVFWPTAGCTCGHPCCCPPDSRNLKTHLNTFLTLRTALLTTGGGGSMADFTHEETRPEWRVWRGETEIGAGAVTAAFTI